MPALQPCSPDCEHNEMSAIDLYNECEVLISHVIRGASFSLRTKLLAGLERRPSVKFFGAGGMLTYFPTLLSM
jgi:hypothetical protein